MWSKPKQTGQEAGSRQWESVLGCRALSPAPEFRKPVLWIEIEVTDSADSHFQRNWVSQTLLWIRARTLDYSYQTGSSWLWSFRHKLKWSDLRLKDRAKLAPRLTEWGTMARGSGVREISTKTSIWRVVGWGWRVVDSSLSYGGEDEYGFKDQDPGSLTQKLCGCSQKGSFVFWKNPQQFLDLLRFKTKINLY